MESRARLKDLEGQRDRLKKELEGLRGEEHSCKQALSNFKLALDHDGKAADEARRRLLQLQTEEEAFVSSESRRRHEHQALQRALEDMHKELDELRNSCERERRAFAEGTARRQSMEAELARCEVEQKFAADMVVEESKRLQEAAKATAETREELGSLQKELSAQQRRVMESGRNEAEVKRRENESRVRDDKLRAEAEMLVALIAQERTQLDIARKELTIVLDQLRRSKEEAVKVEQLAQQRLMLLDDLERLRVLEREEAQRLERLESSSASLQNRLKDMHADAAKSEERAERLRQLADEEGERVDAHRKTARLLENELKDLEGAVSRGRATLDEERRRAIADLGVLSQAKLSVQSQVFTATEARRRAQGDSMQPDDIHIDKLHIKQNSFHSSVAGSDKSATDGQPISSFDANVLRFELEKLREQSQEVLKSVGLGLPVGGLGLGPPAGPRTAGAENNVRMINTMNSGRGVEPALDF